MPVWVGQGYYEPLKAYLKSGKAFYGICLGMQSLFEGSEETPGTSSRLRML